MNKFEVGQSVLVRPDVVRLQHEPPYLSGNCIALAGQVVTISYVYKDCRPIPCYRIDKTGPWMWREDCFIESDVTPFKVTKKDIMKLLKGR